MTEERMRILEMIEQGAISAEEGARLIQALEEDTGEDFEAQAEAFDEAPEPPPTQMDPPPDIGKWRHFWYIPLAVGVVITTISGLLVYAGVQGDWNWFWMLCVWNPLLFGLAVVVMSWFGRTARWLHVRVNTGEDEWPRRIALSFPLPIGLTALGLRLFGNRIPGVEGVRLDKALLALKDGANPETPLYIEVDETSGERVQVYIG